MKLNYFKHVFVRKKKKSQPVKSREIYYDTKFVTSPNLGYYYRNNYNRL